MAKFTYLVTVTVPDTAQEVSSVYGPEKAFALPADMANMVMIERLTPYEDYGFDYTIDYERKD